MIRRYCVQLNKTQTLWEFWVFCIIFTEEKGEKLPRHGQKGDLVNGQKLFVDLTWHIRITALPGWLNCLYQFLFIPFHFKRGNLSKHAILLDHKTQNKNEKDFTYHQYLGEWDIWWWLAVWWSTFWCHNLGYLAKQPIPSTKKAKYCKMSTIYLHQVHIMT